MTIYKVFLAKVIFGALIVVLAGGLGYTGRPIFASFIGLVPLGAGDILTMDSNWLSFTSWPIRVAFVESALAYLAFITLVAARKSVFVALVGLLAVLWVTVYYPFTWYLGAPMVLCIALSITAMSASPGSGSVSKNAEAFVNALWHTASALAFPFAIFFSFEGGPNMLQTVTFGLIGGFFLHLACLVNVPSSYINRTIMSVITIPDAQRGVTWRIAMIVLLVVNEVVVFVPVVYQALFYDLAVPLGGSFLFVSLALFMHRVTDHPNE